MQDLSQVDMGERYKNWMEALARWTVIAIAVGKEVAGEAYLKRLEEEFYNGGRRNVRHWTEVVGLEETAPDCMALGKIMDAVDDSFANWWDGYVENSPKAFEKHILTCPVAKAFRREPDFCERLVGASALGMLQGLNPKAHITFDKFLSKGDETCHYRIEIKE